MEIVISVALGLWVAVSGIICLKHYGKDRNDQGMHQEEKDR